MGRLIALVLALSLGQGVAAEQWVQRGTPPLLIELYTSEGCSSCPPADQRLATLLQQPGLWQQWVPIAYHVDYWDYLGWRDPFAQPQFSLRQRAMRQRGYLRSVYTPGWLVDGREWRGFFSGQAWPSRVQREAGELHVDREQRRVRVRYFGTEAGPLEARLVLLGFDRESSVAAGENAGRRLRHQFVALQALGGSGRDQWEFQLQPQGDGREALAVWITRAGEARPLQLVGGWLTPES